MLLLQGVYLPDLIQLSQYMHTMTKYWHTHTCVFWSLKLIDQYTRITIYHKMHTHVKMVMNIVWFLSILNIFEFCISASLFCWWKRFGYGHTNIQHILYLLSILVLWLDWRCTMQIILVLHYNIHWSDLVHKWADANALAFKLQWTGTDAKSCFALEQILIRFGS